MRKTVNSNDVFKALRTNQRERYWKEKIIAISVLCLLILAIILTYNLFKSNSTADFSIRLKGKIGEKETCILVLSSQKNEISGHYFDACDSVNKIFFKGKYLEDNKLELKDVNGDILQGNLMGQNEFLGRKIFAKSNKTLEFSFQRYDGKTDFICKARVFDTDKDNVPDSLDKCPELAGIPQNNGCPSGNVDTGKIILKVKGANWDELRDKLNQKSTALMSGVPYRLENYTLDPIKNVFSCTLIPDKSQNFMKIVMAWGPENMGYCESCSNILRRNPGSKQLLQEKNNGYYVSIIALAWPDM
ncbi:MAG: hypothetical protein ACK452_16425, partial [Bacteroidota bacterium]